MIARSRHQEAWRDRPATSVTKVFACIALIMAAGIVAVPALAADPDLERRIDALQKEIEALKAQMKAQMEARSAPSDSSAGPAGFELSIYGVGHLSADRIDAGATSSSYIHSNSSRLGFRGSQALNGATAVIFQYESGVDLSGKGVGDGNGPATSGGQIFTRTRDAFVGLKGSFGSVVFGRQGGLNQWVYDYNLFGDQVGDLGNIWGGDGLPGRLDSTVKYTTPDLSGVTLGLTYAPNQGTSSTSTAIGKADFSKGGFKLGGAYARFGQGTGLQDWKVGAITTSYGTATFNVGGGWQRETDIAGVSGADRNKYTIGGGINVGSSGMVKVQYARANDMSGVADSGARQWAIGYDYSWNKDTTAYAAYAKTNNDAGAAYSADNYGHGNQDVPAIVGGANPSGLSVGLVYKFDVGLVGRR